MGQGLGTVPWWLWPFSHKVSPRPVRPGLGLESGRREPEAAVGSHVSLVCGHSASPALLLTLPPSGAAFLRRAVSLAPAVTPTPRSPLSAFRHPVQRQTPRLASLLPPRPCRMGALLSDMTRQGQRSGEDRGRDSRRSRSTWGALGELRWMTG